MFPIITIIKKLNYIILHILMNIQEETARE